MTLKKIGIINNKTIDILGLPTTPDTPIFIAETNIDHIKSEHPQDYIKYGHELESIISQPDYVSLHPNNGSIQYIKVFFDEEKEEHVLVAVRTSKSGIFFVRSLFVMSDDKVKSYTKRNMLKPYEDKK